MISHKKYTIGVILCIYGVIKIMVGTLDYILSSNQMDRLHDIPLIKNFVTKDHTISGKMIRFSMEQLVDLKGLKGQLLYSRLMVFIIQKILKIFSMSD